MLAACPVKPGRNGEPVNFALRPYQREAIAATIKGFDEFHRQLIVCPTGSGKTLLFVKTPSTIPLVAPLSLPIARNSLNRRETRFYEQPIAPRNTGRRDLPGSPRNSKPISSAKRRNSTCSSLRSRIGDADSPVSSRRCAGMKTRLRLAKRNFSPAAESIQPYSRQGPRLPCDRPDMQRRAAGLATYKQVRTLRKFGVPDCASHQLQPRRRNSRPPL